MRASTWQLVWNPVGESPRVLLDYDDLMDDEIQRSLSQLTSVLRYDGATAGRPVGRLNKRRRLTLVRQIRVGSPEESWAGVLEGAAADPWNEKQLLKITRLDGAATYVRAALLNSDRTPVSDGGLPCYREQISLRVDSGLVPTGPLLTIINGWFNPPILGGGTSSGGITIVIDGEDTGLEPGDIIHVGGVTGVPDGAYPVSGVSTGGGSTTVTVTAPTNNHPRDETDISGSHRDGTVFWQYTGSKIYIDGCTGPGTWQWRLNGSSWTSFTPDSFGRFEVPLGIQTAQIGYNGWWSTVTSEPGETIIDPLPIDGGSHERPAGGSVNESTIGKTITVELGNSGTVVDTQDVTLSIMANKAHSIGGAQNHTLSRSAISFSLHGNGGTSRRDTGVSQPITGGNVQKLQ